MTLSEDMEYGFDFAFAPTTPDDPEYRQAYGNAQLKWLEMWEPKEGSWVQ
jgi:hypothetical protein